MLTDRNIAFFIDVDGLRIKTENYQNAIEQLESMGTILHGKLYGCGERKHRTICKEAELKGYKLERVKRIKRRGRREFDNRIFVDVVDTVCTTPAVDAVCIASPSCDMVYLYSYLRAKGIKIIALDNIDDAGLAFIDEILDIGIVSEITLPKPKKERAAKPAAPKASNNDLLREIESLKAMVSEQGPQETIVREIVREVPVEQEPVQEAKQEPVAAPVEEVVEEPVEVAAEEVDEAKELIEKYRAVASGEEPEAEAEVAGAHRAPKAAYAPQNDSDLIRKIEEIRNSGGSDVPEDLADHIKKLLDGID